MKKVILSLYFLALSVGIIYAEKVNYFFDNSIQFDPKIPSPEQFLGYEIGSRITPHHDINAYLEELARLSDRAQIFEIGRTHEGRKLKILTVSDPSNLAKLDAYKQERTKVRKAETPETPLILFLGYSVHGNETSGAEASLLSSYYLVAAQNDFVKKQLTDGIYFIDPVRNPDGQERFAEWVESNRSINFINTHPSDREHSEGWPRGRGNHYWFDLNRDWVNIVHPESQARVTFYQDWLPHVQVDHHEMGANSSFFFEPTDPNGNESRFVPKSTYKLNAEFGNYYAKALDKIGSFYYSKEEYDNKNPNFGSTYPDYNGGVGILFEQGSSRGIQQNSDNGPLTFAHTLRNQLVTSIVTINAANNNRKALFDLQKEFFTVDKGSTKSYIIGDSYDQSRLYKFINLLLAHHLDVFENNQDVTINGNKFEKGKSYIIPVGQPNSALVQIIFDDKKDYTDASKLGYGAGFNVAYSTGLAYELTNTPAKGAKVETVREVAVKPFQQSDYAYLVDFRDSKVQQFLFRLLEKDLIVKTSSRPFSANTAQGVINFTYGTLLIPVSNQNVSSSELYGILKTVSEKERVNVIPVETGYSVKGADLGSSSFNRIRKPTVLLVTGGFVSSNEAGEVWHLFDQKLRYPIVRVEQESFGRISLSSFNRIVFAGGSYNSLDARSQEALKNWINSGGVLITIGSASSWAINSKLIETPVAVAPQPTGRRQGQDSARVEASAALQRGGSGGGRVPTSVFETKINLNSPLAYGLTREILAVPRESAPSLPATGNVVATYTDSPLLNGYADEAALRRFKTSASVRTSGSIILFGDNPLFRGIWDGTERTFVNAILFGDRVGRSFGRFNN
ncbi:hypothetical protein EZS27_005717 [termite gut metagenome]|uniref:Peptidase M14 domain-containing protein n=1 Tax=termite gut metagenome TaxID=433724 RepID=A0A5J4SM35_9ZZZZ